jgi:hypothetical protein
MEHAAATLDLIDVQVAIRGDDFQLAGSVDVPEVDGPVVRGRAGAIGGEVAESGVVKVR